MKVYKVVSLPIVQVLLGFFIFGLFSLLLIVETIVFAAFFTVVACGAADQVARKFVSDRLCSVLLAATVSLSGFSSKLQIVILAVGGALLASGLISIVGWGRSKKISYNRHSFSHCLACQQAWLVLQCHYFRLKTNKPLDFYL